MTPAALAFGDYATSGSHQSLCLALDLVTPALLRIARRYGSCDHEVADLLHETFLIAIERRARFDPSRDLRPWLTSILIHVAQQRRAKRRFDPLPGETEALPDEPLARLAREELLEVVEERMATLPARYRTVVEAHLYEGLSPREIALRFGRKASTVRTQLARGLRLLRAGLVPVGLLAWSSAWAGVVEVGPASVQTSSLRRANRAWLIATVFCLWLGILVLESIGGFVWASPGTESKSSLVVSQALEADPETPRDVAVTRTPLPASTPFAALRVRVSWEDGSPAAGLAFVLSQRPVRGRSLLQASFHQWRFANTDANGEATLFQLETGNARLLFDDAGRVQSPEFLLRAGEVHREEVTLLHAGVVRGRVLDAEGTPIAGALVSVSSTAFAMSPGRVVAVSGVDGHYEFDATRTQGTMRVSAPGHGTSVTTSVFPSGAVVARHEFVLERARRSVRGVVESSQGVLLEDVIVGAVPLGTDAYTPHYTLTDERGAFVFEGLRDLEYLLVARPRAGPPAWLLTSRLAERHTLRIPQPAEVRVHLTKAPGGEEEEEVLVAIHPSQPELRPAVGLLLSSAYVRTGEPFSFETVAPGRNTLFVPRGTQALNRELDAPAGSTTYVEWSLPPRNVLVGRVVETTKDPPLGIPVEGVRVSVLRADLDPRVAEPFVREAVTDAEGRFQVAMREEGEFLIGIARIDARSDAGRPPFAIFPKRCRSGDVITLELPEGAVETVRVRGLVRDAHGLPPNEATLRLRRKDWPISSSEPISSTGDFAIDVAAGDYVLSIVDSDAGLLAPRLEVSVSSQDVDLGCVTLPGLATLTLAMSPRSALEREIAVLDAQGNLLEYVPARALASLELPAGRYILRRPSPALETLDVVVVLRAGETSRVDLSLETGTLVRWLFPFDPKSLVNDQPGRLHLTLARNEGRSVERCIPIPAVAAFEDRLFLSRGTYSLVARTAFGPEVRHSFDVAEGVPELTVRLTLRAE